MGRTSIRLLSLLHRVCLMAYPRRFRVRYGTELERIFTDSLAETARVAPGRAIRRAAVECVGAVGSGLAERFSGAPDPARPRTSRGRRAMDTFGRDLRLAIRMLRRGPGFAAIAVLTIALGIGANTAMFSVVRSVLLRPLPYAEPDRLVLLWGELTRRGVRNFPTSPPDLADYRRQATRLESVAGIFTFQQPLTAPDGTAEQIMTAGVTANTLSVLGIRPMLGRDFNEEDGRPVANPDGAAPAVNTAAILDHALWRDRFGADPGVIGRIIEIGGNPAEVIGVMPPGTRLHMPATAGLARDVDVWFAMRLDYDAAPRNNVFLTTIARLAPGVTAAAAQQELDGITAELRARFPIKESSGFAVRVVPLHEDLVRPVRPIILALMGAVAFVLLVACANVANLLMVRAVGRERELAVRAALGGTRSRLVRQLVAESLVLGAAGAIAGVLIAVAGVRAVLALAPGNLPRLDDVSIDAGVLVFTAALTLGAVAIFGVVPALRASRPTALDVLREGRNPGLGRGRRFRNSVVIAEVAVSLVLLVGAGLMARSLDTLRRVDPGWQPDGLLAFDISLPFGRFTDTRERAAFIQQFQAQLAAMPGVESASAALPLPFDGTAFHGRWGTEDALSDPDAFRQADYVAVLPGYLETIGSRLLAGRLLTEADAADSAAVVVVDQRLARIAFADEPAVGQDIFVRLNRDEMERVRIVGVIENQRRSTLIDDEREAIYMTAQFAGTPGAAGFVVRTVRSDSRQLTDPIRAALRALDPGIPLSNPRRLHDDLDRAGASTRFALVLLGSFASLALLLAAVGLYGVLSFAVRQRTAEIGVRLAFGAPRGRIVLDVVARGLALAAAGIALGLLAALALTRLIASMLVGVTPRDPATFAVLALLFLAVAAFASWIPARRAAALDPATALRED